eukprot:scaffold1638_cov120-Cylindrotheca_fusiformis.AAC.6
MLLPGHVIAFICLLLIAESYGLISPKATSHQCCSKSKIPALFVQSSPSKTENGEQSNRRQFMHSISTIGTLGTVLLPASAAVAKSRTQDYPLQKTDEEWQSILSATQFEILRKGGTERPYSSILEGEERPGVYSCAGCGTKLFLSSEKFHSGTGWPSFAKGLESGVEVEEVNAVQANLVGAEIRCASCGGHLGDVFNDGWIFPGTPAFVSGKRYCVDGAALVFQPRGAGDIVSGDQPPQAIGGRAMML